MKPITCIQKLVYTGDAAAKAAPLKWMYAPAGARRAAARRASAGKSRRVLTLRRAACESAAHAFPSAGKSRLALRFKAGRAPVVNL